MRIPGLSVVVTLATVLALAGCPPPAVDVDAGPDDDDAGVLDAGVGADAGPGDAVDVATFCASLHGAVCAGFTSCGCTLEGRAFTAETCAPTRAAACEQALGEAVPFFDSGDVVIDPVSSVACLATIASLVEDCKIVDATTLPPACAVVLLDSAALDEGCSLSSTPALCAEGAGLCAGPTCAALPADGEPCAGGILCASGFACSEGTCRPPVPEPPLVDVGGACVATAQCVAGLVCTEGACAAGPARGDACGGPVCSSGDACVRDYESRVCAERAAVGEACEASAEDACVAGAFCDVDACAPLPGDGEACTPNLDCAAPFLCDADNGLLCVLPPNENEACLVGSALCAIGLGCNEQQLCVPGPGVGAACLFPNNLCADGLACDFTFEGSFCAERRGEGGACQNDVVCADGLFCDDTTCAPARATGDPCPTGGGCAITDECNDLGGGFTCQPRPTDIGDVCLEGCGDALACAGLGGACAPALCASP